MKIRPVSFFDMPAMQAWLEDCAAKGQFLVDFYRGGTVFARFEEGEPKKVRYRLEPMIYDEMKQEADERVEAYAAAGWKHVTRIGSHFHIWRCDDPEAPELFTDPTTEAMAYQRLHRRLIWSDLGALALCLVAVGLVVWLEWSHPDTLLLDLVDGIGWRMPFFFLLLPFLLLVMFLEIHSLRRLLRLLRAGIPIPHRAPYGRALILGRVEAVAYCLVTAGLLCNIVSPFVANSRFDPQRRIDYEDLTERPPVVALSLLVPGVEEDLRGSYVRDQSNWLAERKEIREWGQRGKESFVAYGNYYRLRIPSLAESLLGQMVEQRQKLDMNLQAVDAALVMAAGLDEAWWAPEEDGRSQHLLVRRGAEILVFYANDLPDFTAYLPDFAAALH